MEVDGSAELTGMSAGPLSAYLLVASLQLAWRHPDLGEFTRNFIEKFGRGIQGCFAGTPVGALLESGWDETQDVHIAEFDPEILGVRVNSGAFTEAGEPTRSPQSEWN